MLKIQKYARGSAAALLLAGVMGSGPLQAVTSADFSALPAELASSGSAPLVMLTMSHDHQMYFKAYSDYSDVGGTSDIDTTYNNDIEYDGYFDPNSCYAYDAADARFEPGAAASSHQCLGVTNPNPWSGNFLNWATMTRMDLLRKALYGGKRFSDPTTGAVVLERAVLPTDGHAFAKVYAPISATDDPYTPYTRIAGVKENYTFCNLTQYSGVGTLLSKDVSAASNPPKLYVAYGKDDEWYDWASSPLKQCQFVPGGSAYSPASSAFPVGNEQDKFNVFVQACLSGVNASNTARCKLYSNGSYKPYGVLQSFGENKSLRFGLMSGSFAKHVAGGLLRRNIGYIADNTVPTENEIDLATGQFLNASLPGVISTLNRLRISQYNFDTGSYQDCATAGITSATFKGSSNCADWGNPLAEIYNETLRYFSAQPLASTAYAGDDSVSHINGLSTVPWVYPMSVNNSCAQCAAVVIGVGANSYDADDISGATGVTGLVSAKVSTSAVAANEGINGNYLIGDNGTTDTGTCTLKSVNSGNFDDLLGICDGAPDEEGGFLIAGLAHHAKTTDLSILAGNQNVDTYAVKFGETLPVFSAAGITFSPYCAAGPAGGEIPCSLVDVQIIEQPTASTGAISVIWDDSSYGSDFNRDAKQFLEYCVGAACDPDVPSGDIQFSGSVIEKLSGGRMTFGFVVSGTAASDGTYAEVTPSDQQFTISGTSTRLKDPLWYAAKYGGFDDIDGGTANFPDSTAEFDTLNESGGTGSDGIPDNYFDVKNPSDLQSRLNTSLARVMASVSLTDNTDSEVVRFAGNKLASGGFYRSFFYPQRTVTGDTINWAGSVHGLFVDDNGYLREDNATMGTRGTLDDMTIDYSVEFSVDVVTGLPVITRYSSRAPNVPVGVFPFESLSPLWDANAVLAGITDDAAITTQRAYDADSPVDAATGRYIFTWIDRDNDGIVEDTQTAATDEVVDFVAAKFPAGATGADEHNFRLLGITDDSLAADIVNFIRGKEIAGMRSRSIDIDLAAPTANEVWRLGDIVNSELIVVGAPEKVYDLRYGDRTYRRFRQTYQNRRQMVYVGGNDGLLHAFNAGRADIVNNKFDADGHTLGAEMWAYAPANLLPHLRWLTEAAYPHVFYVDGAIRAFDVNIFPPSVDTNGDGVIDGDYPGGWGTILVAGMRLGGADIDVDTDGVGGTDKTMRSAYVILDITNPENPPKLIAEISDPNLNFTTGAPALVKRRVAATGGFTAPSSNEWMLVFGSGPDSAAQTLSTQNSRLFAYDLVAKQLITLNAGLSSGVAESNAFVGDITAADWDDDFVDDTLYFGTIGGSVTAPTGVLKRVVLDEAASNVGLASTATASTMINVGKPVVPAPVTFIETIFADRWVLFGTGRGFVGSDFVTTAQQAYYGVREPADASGFTNGTVTAGALFDVTGIKTGTNGSIVNDDDTPVTDGADTIETFGELKNVVRDDGGWQISFSTPTGEAAERNFTGTTKFGKVALFTTFQPDGASCDVDGDGFLYGVDAFTGVAPPFAPLGTTSDVLLTTRAQSVVPLSRGGVPGQPQVYRSEKGGPQVFVEGRKGSTTLQDLDDSPVPSGRQSWEEIDFEIR